MQTGQVMADGQVQMVLVGTIGTHGVGVVMGIPLHQVQVGGGAEG